MFQKMYQSLAHFSWRLQNKKKSKIISHQKSRDHLVTYRSFMKGKIKISIQEQIVAIPFKGDNSNQSKLRLLPLVPLTLYREQRSLLLRMITWVINLLFLLNTIQ